MASDLPDVLEKLALQAEQSEDAAESSSLSKYFGQSDASDDIFDVIAKPARTNVEEPKINFVINSPSSEVKEGSPKVAPTFAFKKGEEDSEPKIFSYFSQPSAVNVTNKNEDATEFFDHISEFTATSQEQKEVSGLPSNPQSTNMFTTHPEKATTTESNVTFEKDIALNIGAPYSSNVSAVSTSSATAIQRPYQEAKTTMPVNVPIINKTHSTDYSNTPERADRWWIPSETTQSYLASLQGNPRAERHQQTCPGLWTSAELADPIKELIRHLDGESAAAQRRNLTADHVTQDDRGIEDLIKAQCYRAAANLCGRLLTAYGQGYGKSGQPSKHSPHSLKLWFVRTSLLYRCRQFETAMNEANAFGDFDSADLYYEFYPEYSSVKIRGSMVPFGYRLVAAMLPAHMSLFREAYAKLCRLLTNVRQIIKQAKKLATIEQMSDSELSEAVALWTQRENQVESCLVDCALMRKDYHNAVQLIKKRIARCAQSPDPMLYTELGRVFLLLGDVMSAQQAFNRAADLRSVSNPNDAIASLMDAGMIAIAQNAFPEAHGYFQKALALQPDHPAVINNVAVCLLYMGSMRDAMLLLEENLGTNPETMIQDYTVLNVCTLYELESSLTAQRKLGMLRLASQWRADNLDVSSFKLSVSS